MTVTPDEGLEAIGDLLLNAVAYVGVGTGSNESTTASGLGNKEYLVQPSNANVRLIETGSTGEYEIIIEVTGGTEVDGGTMISETAAFDGDPDSGGNVLFIDGFAEKEVEAGHTEEFTIPVDPQRV